MRAIAGFRMPAAPSRWGRLLVAALVLCLGPGGAPIPAAAPPAESSGRRIVLIGLDAADWIAIDPMVRAGRLPTFARLRAAGRSGVMLATPPLISPIVWTTVATGVHPENHGILDFMVDLPDGTQAPIASSHRLAAALWNLFSDAGRSVAVVGWWATWPAESVRGTIVSDALAPQLTRGSASVDVGLAWPASAAKAARRALVAPEAVSFDDMGAYVPLTRDEYTQLGGLSSLSPRRFYENKLAHLASVVASTRTYSSIAVTLARTERPDFTAVYLESIDTISHLFVRDDRRGARSIARAYQDADDLIRRLAEASPPDTLVVVCSDHGFHPPTAAIAEDPSNLTGSATAWHRPYGIVAAVEAGVLLGHTQPAAGGGRDIGIVTPIDVAPTLLHAAGLAVPSDMPGRVVTGLLPADAAGRAVRRAPASRFAPPSAARVPDQAQAEAWARLQALGYVGATGTSLARRNLGEIFYRRGNLEAAERELRSVAEARPTDVTAGLWLAKTLRDQGRKEEALRKYEAIVVLPAGAREAVVEGADLAVAMGRLDRAASLVRKAGGATDAGASLPLARGIVAEAENRRGDAEREYRAALQLDPVSFDAASRLFDLLSAAGRAGEAVTLLRAATTRAPESAQHQALLGSVLLASRDAAGARAALERALVLAPDSDSVRIELARAQFTLKDPDVALATLAMAGPSAQRSVLLGAVYSSLGRWHEATRELQGAIDGGTVTPDVLNALGWAQLKLGRAREAASAFSRSLEMRRDQPEVRRLLADAQAGATSR